MQKKCKVKNILHFGYPHLKINKELSIHNLKRVKRSLQYLWKLRAGVAPYKPDVIIPFLNAPSKISFYLYKMFPSVKFTFWHQLGLDSTNGCLLERYAAYNMPCVIGNAENCFEMFQDQYPLPKNKLNLLPQYVTLQKEVISKIPLKGKYNIPDDAIVIGMIAHYRIDKYFDILFDAFINLNKRSNKKVHLILLGNKENGSVSLDIYNNLKLKVKRFEATNSISVLSNCNVVDILNMLDISVLMSQIEGMPNSVMEYMLYGLPAVVTEHPGCKQLLLESEFLIPNDVEILTQKLNKLVDSEELRLAEGNLNLERIKKFNLPSYVENLERIIAKHIER